MNSKQRRAIKKQVGAETQEKMANQVAQFGKMPEQCQICQKEFDKKEMTSDIFYDTGNQTVINPFKVSVEKSV